MTLRAPAPPPNGRDIARGSALQTPRKRVATTALREAPEGHEVFAANVRDVIERRLLANARRVSWRYLADGEAADIVERNGQWHFDSHVSGAAGEALEAALATAVQIAANRDYELRALSIPAVYATALWLHGEDDDILIPIAPAPRALVANRSYSEATFTEALLPLAQKRSRIRGDQA